MTRHPAPIVYVCFRHAKPPVGDIGQTVRRALGLPPDPAFGESGRIENFSTESGLVSLLEAPFPYPASDLTDDLGQRAAWPHWRTEIATWKSHVIVTIVGSDAEFEMRKRKVAMVLRVASIAAGHPDASAVGWSGNVLFHAAPDFIDLTAKAAIPTEIVVRTLWRTAGQSKDQRPEVKTQGLRLFGLPEIEHPATGEDAATLYNRVMNLSTYLIANGPVIKDGDTIGSGSTPNMRVRHTTEPNGESTLIIERVGH